MKMNEDDLTLQLKNADMGVLFMVCGYPEVFIKTKEIMEILGDELRIRLVDRIF